MDKIESSAAWFGPHAGAAVAGMVQGAMAQTTGAHAQVLGLSASLGHALIVPTAPFWGYVIPFAEVLAGLGILLGGLTGTALAEPLVMNLVYMLMGSDGVNPVMFAVQALMLGVGPAVAAWGLDHVAFHDWVTERLLLRPVEPTPAPEGGHHAA